MMNPERIIVGLGEVLWDVFPDAALFGGAPANFACSAAALGGDIVQAYVVSAVGPDELGQRAIESLLSHGVDTQCVMQVENPTGRVLIELDSTGQASYEFPDDVAWDNVPWSVELEKLAASADVVCFGSLAQRCAVTRETVQRFLRSSAPYTLKVFDVNLRPPPVAEATILESLALADVLKLNDEELPRLASLIGATGTEVEIMRDFAKQFDLQLVALTRGADGAVLLRDEQLSVQAGVTTEVVDTVGAGDAFTASLVLGMLAEEELGAINEKACRVAAYVCSQPGATPGIPAELVK